MVTTLSGGLMRLDDEVSSDIALLAKLAELDGTEADVVGDESDGQVSVVVTASGDRPLDLGMWWPVLTRLSSRGFSTYVGGSGHDIEVVFDPAAVSDG